MRGSGDRGIRESSWKSGNPEIEESGKLSRITGLGKVFFPYSLESAANLTH